MCHKEIGFWVKLGLLGKIGAFRKNDSAQGATVVKQGFCTKSVCFRDFEEIWTFWEENGTFGKKSVQKGHFGENLAVKVKTGLIQKMSVPKLLEVKIWSFG